MTTDSQPKNTVIDLTPGKPGRPRKYTDEERKQLKREWARKYYKENREKCDLNNKLCRLRAKGVVEWQGIVLVPKQKKSKKIYTDEEIKQCKRDYYKNNHYVNHRDICIERARKSHLRQKAAKAM